MVEVVREVAEDSVAVVREAAVVLDRAADFLVDRDHLLAALRRSTDRPRGHRLRQHVRQRHRGHPFRVLDRVSAVVIGQVLVEETLEAIVRALAEERGIVPTLGAVAQLAIVLRHCPALGRERALVPAQELETDQARDRGSPIGLASRSNRGIACRDSARPLARERSEVRSRIDCRTKGHEFKTAWPIGRRWRIDETTSAIVCRMADRTGKTDKVIVNRIAATAKTIAKIGATTIAKTGRIGRATITTAGITAVGIPEQAGATCGTTIRSRPRSV